LLPAVPAAAADDQLLEEVIVSARKREESLLQVPVIESVISKEALENNATIDLYSVATRVPGILIGNNVGAVSNQLSMRGIGTTALTATIDQSVSLNIDGLQLSQALAYGVGMFDVEQVEVLKGPQALFYGKNSPAGVISLRSADPTDQAEVTVRGGYEYEAEQKMGELILSGPVAQSLRLRLATHYDEQEGFFINDAIGNPAVGGRTPAYKNVSPARNWTVRGTALFDPVEWYSARLKLNYSQDSLEGMTYTAQAGYCPDGTAGVAPVNIPFMAQDNCKVDRRISNAWPDPAAFPGIRNGGVMFADVDQQFGTLEQNFAFTDHLSLAAITGYYDVEDDTLYPGSTGSPPTLATAVNFSNRQFTQELRLTSDWDNPVNFMLGGFYQSGDMENRLLLHGNTALRLPAIVQSVLHQVDIESLSAFGQAIWDVTDKWELAAGARWTHETRDHVEYNYNPSSGPVGAVPLPDPHLSADNLSPEVSVTYKPTDDLTLFGSYKEGFKSGSFNTVQYIAPTTKSAFDDEQVSGGEVGIKARMLDRRMLLSVAGYYYRYDDLQVGANERNPDGTIALRTLNAASADVYGVDLDVTYDPSRIEGLSLYAAVNWNHARYATFDTAPCGNGQTAAQGCDQVLNPVTGRFTAQDLSGEVLVRAPDWMATGGIDYKMPIGTDMTLLLGASLNYTSEYSTALVNLPGFFQDAYMKANANIALKGPDDRWTAALIGNNLGNEITAGVCSNNNSQNGGILGGQINGGLVQGPAGSDEASCVAERGRQVWLRLSFSPRWFAGS
jgi:iron complex outermembrane receptor protein